MLMKAGRAESRNGRGVRSRLMLVRRKYLGPAITSALGSRWMSALPPKADIRQAIVMSALCHKADTARMCPPKR
jgi:hypothetical protein